MHIEPFSPDWNAREQAWANECNANFEAAADELVAQGYTRQDHDRRHYPSTFHKDGETQVLVRDLGSSKWRARTYSTSTMHHL